MNYCMKCGKPVDNGMMCEDCMVNSSSWQSVMTIKENYFEQEIVELKAENVALKKRLEKAVELPCKIGDTIYHVSNLELQELKVISFEITENHGILCYTRDKNGDLYILAGGLFDTWVFVDKAEAEVKLSELKGTTNNQGGRNE